MTQDDRQLALGRFIRAQRQISDLSLRRGSARTEARKRSLAEPATEDA
jgi:hypothetical protein